MTITPTFDNLPSHTDRTPIVAIVGAGIAGLTLAILLEQQGIEYNIFERAKEVKPPGSSMALGAAVNPLFKQMDIFDEFVRLGKVFDAIQVYTDKREYDYRMDFGLGAEMCGCDSYIIARPVLYEILLNRIPSHRLHLNKRVLSIAQNHKGVMIQTSDNQTHETDILIGADGAHSAVRQGLYAQLKDEKRLPTSDDAALPFSCVNLVGQTAPLDSDFYPKLASDLSEFINVQGEGTPFSEVGESPIYGAAPGATPLTLGDLINATPKHLISKVMLEEKVFDTWYGGRTALIGDACHKINPSGGQGALLAIHDAVCIANWISVLPSTKIEDVQTIFQKYKKERYPLASAAFDSSQMFRNMAGKNMWSKITRYMAKRMPAWLWKIVISGIVGNRPQVSLPLVKDTGKLKPAYQASLNETLKIHKKKGVVAV